MEPSDNPLHDTPLHPAVTALRQLFFTRLMEQSPRSVLDVACGDAHLLRALKERGVRAVGVESSEERVNAAREQGFEVYHGDAESLHFEDGLFDWTAMRHAAHHLADPELGIRELSRVAGTGFIAAEPWRELAEPAQQLAAEWDAWCRVQERRRGDIHHDNLVIASLSKWLATPDQWICEYTYYQPAGVRPLDEVRAQAESLSPLATDAELSERDRLLTSAARVGVGITGTAILVARRQPS